MRTIGLIGGISWQSTQVYYRLINEDVARRLGGAHSARVLLDSLDFDEVAALQRAGDWDGLAAMFAGSARRLERGGAACVAICANTMHKVAPQVAEAVSLPLVDLITAVGAELARLGVRRTGLLGTRYTMEQPFYLDRLRGEHGLEVLVPEAADRDIVHRVIYDELCNGLFLPASREAYKQVIADLAARGAQAVILGCTEIPLLVGPEDAAVPLVDTTAVHAKAAVDFALGEAG